MASVVLGGGDDYAKLCHELEKQELEAPGGNASSHVYEQMLALLLLKNDMCNAKYLWKRIPQSVKAANNELNHVWAVGQQMWQRDYNGVYNALKREWSPELKQIMEAVAESTKNRALHLVGQAYSSISVDDLSLFVGLSPEETIALATEISWNVDLASRMISPVKPVSPLAPIKPNEEQLSKLTEFVSFLEN